MNRQGLEQSLLSRVWAVVLSVLGLAIAANVTWALLRPLLPLMVGIAVVVALLGIWNQRRWR